MINIIIKIKGLGIGDESQAILFLSNNKNKLLERLKTYNGQIEVSLKPNCLYNLLIISNQGRKNISFYVDNKRKCYCFSIFDIITRKIIFRLKDANYENLPIEKGAIILWLK